MGQIIIRVDVDVGMTAQPCSYRGGCLGVAGKTDGAVAAAAAAAAVMRLGR